MEDLPIVQTGTPTQQERVLIGSIKPEYLDMNKEHKVPGTITLPEMTFKGLDGNTYVVKAGSRWLPSPDSRIMMLDAANCRSKCKTRGKDGNQAAINTRTFANLEAHLQCIV